MINEQVIQILIKALLSQFTKWEVHIRETGFVYATDNVKVPLEICFKTPKSAQAISSQSYQEKNNTSFHLLQMTNYKLKNNAHLLLMKCVGYLNNLSDLTLWYNNQLYQQ